MGRPSKLTEAQWSEIQRRLLEGENRSALAREFKITEGAIRQKVSANVEKIKNVANQMVATEKELAKMSVSTRFVTTTYAHRMMSIQDNMLAGVDLAAANFHRLQALASTELAKVDDAEPITANGSGDRLKSHLILTKAANEAATVPVNLLSANKERLKTLGEKEDSASARPPEPTEDAAEATKRYLDFING